MEQKEEYSVSLEELARVADRAALAFDGKQIATLQKNMSAMLRFVSPVCSAEATEEEEGMPASFAAGSDEVLPSMARERLLSIAPEVAEGCVRVPRVVGGSDDE